MKPKAIFKQGRWAIASIVFLTGAIPGLGQGNTVIHPVKRFQGPSAISDSTLSVFPQINPSYSSTRKMSSRNSNGPPVLKGAPNSLLASNTVTNTTNTIKAMYPGISFTGWFPPDPNLAVGPNHAVIVVNSDIAFFNKATGAKVFQQAMSPTQFFSGLGATDFIFDPKCFYDQISKRFFVIALEQNDAQKISKCLVAVSDDTDPNGTWHKYRIESKLTISGNESWLDYPGWGFNKDVIVITGNMFGFTTGYTGTQIITLTKAEMLTGAPPTVTAFQAPGFTIQPTRTHDATNDKVYCVGQDTTSSLRVYAIQNVLTTPTIVATSLAVPTFQNGGLAQSTNGAGLDVLYPRCLTAYYRAGRIVSAHSCATNTSGGRNVARWYDIKVNSWPASGAPSLHQSGNVGASNAHFFQPAIAVNKNGAIGMIFNGSSSSVAADIFIASRAATDPVGSMGAPTKLASSTGNPSPGGNRWGDYFAACIDPVDDTTFWGVCQTVTSGGNWTTHWFKWNVAGGGGGGGTVILPAEVKLFNNQGAILSGNLSSITSSNDQFLAVQALLNPVLGYVAAVEVTFNTGKVPSKVTSMTFSTETITNTPVNATCMYWIYNWQSGLYEHKISFTLPSAGNAMVQLPFTSNFAKYVSPTGQVKFVVRGLTPITSGTNTRPFNMLMDYCKLEGEFLP